jgi:predicted transporter
LRILSAVSMVFAPTLSFNLGPAPVCLTALAIDLLILAGEISLEYFLLPFFLD